MSGRVLESAWYLAQVRPNQFHIAQANLKRQGFPVFAPTQEETRQRGGHFLTERRALFPGYLFVTFDPTSSAWLSINSTYGISKLVSFGGVPRPVPAALVTDLMTRCDAAGHLLPPPELRPGDQVQVLSGPFAHFVAGVESLAPQRRVWVLLNIMGSQTRVSLEAGQLRTLSPPNNASERFF